MMTAALFASPSYAQAEKPDPDAGAVIAKGVCAACHGADGNSALPVNPNLAGQHAEYTYKQLSNFKSIDGATPMRNNAIMAGFAATLSDADMRNLAAYFAAQTPKPAVAKDKDLAELGRQIWRGGIAAKGVPSCAGCHGPTGLGMPAQYPKLQGQHAEYTAAQLTAWRQGERGNSAQMAAIAARLSDQEIKALAEYAAGLR
ncbi:MAG: cytochrome c [Burkholderiaceae bacterium]